MQNRSQFSNPAVYWYFFAGAVLGGWALVGAVGIRCTTAESSGWCRWVARGDTLSAKAYRASWVGQTADGMSLFREALRADPASPYRWCDLGEAMLDDGQPEAGRRCLARAVELGPRMPQILLRAANFGFRSGAPDEALRFAARALALTPDYDAAIFSSYSRMGVETAAILDHGLPREARPAAAFFRYTLARAAADDAAQVWAWMARNSFNTDRLADEYAGFLLARGEGEAAVRMWAAQMAAREAGYLKTNWLCNEYFTREPEGYRLGWHIAPVEGVQVVRDGGRTGDERSLRIDFPGTSNLSYSQVGQTTFLVPGTYRFSAVLKTDRITTDEGIGLRIFDRGDPGKLDVRTRVLRGTNDWTAVESTFRVAGASVVEVQVVRTPSQKFDNKFAGTVWMTQVRVERVKG